MAKRIQFAAYGGPEVLEYRDYQPAEPGPGSPRAQSRHRPELHRHLLP